MASEREVFAGLEVLVAVAKADGRLAPEEIAALEHAIQERGVSIDVKALTERTIDLGAALAEVTDPDVRNEIFIAAAAIAHTDKRITPEEAALLLHIQRTWEIRDHVAAEAKRLAGISSAPYGEAYGPRVAPAPVAPVVPPRERSEATKKAIYLASSVAAGFGIVPIPLIPDLAVLVVQGSLLREIAGIYGKTLSDKEFSSIQRDLAGLSTTRIAVSSVMKLVPVVGSVFGGSTAFVTTWAIGTSTERTLAKGGSLADAKAFKQEFEAAKKEGKTFFEAHKAEIESDAKFRAQKAKDLSAALKDGRITQEEFDRATAALAR